MTAITSTTPSASQLARLLATLQARNSRAQATEAAAPDLRNADRAADALATAAPSTQIRGGATVSRLAPVLSAPAAPEPSTAALQTLHAALDGDAGPPAEMAVFMQSVVRTIGEQELPSLRGTDLPAAGLDDDAPSPTPPAALQDTFKSLIGLQSQDGELVFPTVKAREALSGLITPTTDGQEPLGTLLSDTPAIASVIDEANAMNDEELSVRMNSDPRFAVVLLLIAFLMKLAASQREQAAGMLVFAEKSVHDMGERMVDSAKQQQLAKVVALVVVVVVSTVAVGVGAKAAARNIKSIERNQVNTNRLHKDVAENELKLASGVNDPKAKTPVPLESAERHELRVAIARDNNQAAVLSAEHAVTQTNAAVANQAGQMLGQASNAAGNLAGSGHEIEAANLTARQEKRRADASAGQQVSQSIGQNTTKVDESGQALFRQAQQAEQDKADARNAIASHIGR